MRKILYLIILILFNLGLVGCAVKNYTPASLASIPSVPGIYHKVRKGETLWQISKRYNVEAKDIVKANKIPDASRINAGQSLFIPYTSKSSHDISYATEKPEFIWPVKGKVIAYFGMNYNGVKSKGISIKAKEGTDVVAASSGRVSFCDDKVKGRGKTIIIDHDNNFVTVYAHNSELLVKVGDVVKQGQIIAKVGSTGRVKTPQLYFEIRQGHIPKNPFYYLP